MTSDQLAQWQKVHAFEIDDPGSAFTFSDRLARENGWSMQYTLRAVREYKKFMFLLIVAEHPLTPSDQVDQVWHLHLLYTRSYWIEFCRNTLGREIHHEPTMGGAKEGAKFDNWYDRTKVTYKTFFDRDPPEDIWPSNKVRFSEINFQRVNLDRHWIIKKLFCL